MTKTETGNDAFVLVFMALLIAGFGMRIATEIGESDMAQHTVTLSIGVDLPNGVDISTSDKYDEAVRHAAEDIATRGVSEIIECICDIEVDE